MSRLPSDSEGVELPECDICTDPLECAEEAGEGGGDAAEEAKGSRVPRLLPCGHSYCTRCIQMGLEANGGLLACPLRCPIGRRQRPTSALQLPKNFTAIRMIQSQADLSARVDEQQAEIARLEQQSRQALAAHQQAQNEAEEKLERSEQHIISTLAKVLREKCSGAALPAAATAAAASSAPTAPTAPAPTTQLAPPPTVFAPPSFWSPSVFVNAEVQSVAGMSSMLQMSGIPGHPSAYTYAHSALNSELQRLAGMTAATPTAHVQLWGQINVEVQRAAAASQAALFGMTFGHY